MEPKDSCVIDDLCDVFVTYERIAFYGGDEGLVQPSAIHGQTCLPLEDEQFGVIGMKSLNLSSERFFVRAELQNNVLAKILLKQLFLNWVEVG